MIIKKIITGVSAIIKVTEKLQNLSQVAMIIFPLKETLIRFIKKEKIVILVLILYIFAHYLIQISQSMKRRIFIICLSA